MKKTITFFIGFILTCTLLAQIPSGYYSSISGKSQTALFNELTNIISSGFITISYTPGVWAAYETTDVIPGTDKIWDMYSNCEFTVRTSQGSSSSEECMGGYNREHSLPKSWWGGNTSTPQHQDLHHLFPTDVLVNAKRGNSAYGEVGTATYTSGNGSKLGTSKLVSHLGVVFEPIDAYKGDFARAQLYMAVRYAPECKSWTRYDGAVIFRNSDFCLTDYAVELYMKWHKQDPVSEKEINRNNAIYPIQYNRNPFVDYPDLADYIWGDKAGEAFTLPDAVQTYPETALYADFAGSLNPFTTYNVTGDQVWLSDQTYAKMTGYVSGANHANEDWLISPALDLTEYQSAKIIFDHVQRYFNNASEEMTLHVSTDYSSGNPNAAHWTALQIPNYSTGTDWNFISSGEISLNSFIGKTGVRIAFKYISTDNAAGTWEIKNVMVQGEKEKSPDLFIENFESTNLTKTNYATADIGLNHGLVWTFTGALAGNSTSDFKIGSKSARLAGKTTANTERSKIEMKSNKPDGIGTVSFKYKQYGSGDTQIRWDVEWSNDGEGWSNIGQITANSTVQTFSMELNKPEARIRIIANEEDYSTGSNGCRVNIDDITMSNYAYSNTVSTPAFTPSQGDYFDEVDVTIACMTDNASIYYTLDGTEPTVTSNLYSKAINITNSTTLRAKAYKDGLNPSSVAAARYNIVEPIDNLAELRAEGSGAKVKYSGNAVVTFAVSDRNIKFLQDASGAIMIDDNADIIKGEYNIGDLITNINGTLNEYNGMLQLLPVSNAEKLSGNQTPVVEIKNPSDISVEDQAKLIKIENVTFSSSGNFAYATNAELAGSPSVVIRPNYTDLNYIGTAIPTNSQNITGVIVAFNSIPQLVPRSTDDFSNAILTGLQENVSTAIYTIGNTLHFNAANNESIEIYNSLGQKEFHGKALEGANTIELNKKGMFLVKIGINKTEKLFLK